MSCLTRWKPKSSQFSGRRIQTYHPSQLMSAVEFLTKLDELLNSQLLPDDQKVAAARKAIGQWFGQTQKENEENTDHPHRD